MTIAVVNGQEFPAPTEPSPSGHGWWLDVTASPACWKPYEPPADAPASVSTLDAVKTTLAPFLHDYQMNLSIYRAMAEQSDRMMRQVAWDADDSRTFRQLHDRIAGMLGELSKAECAIELVERVLKTIYGDLEVDTHYPELWTGQEAMK